MTALPAPRWKRLIATAIDMVLVPALTLLLVMATGVVEDPEDFQDMGWILHVLLLAVLAYLLLNGWLLFRRGQTIGKAAAGIMMVSSQTTNVPPFWRLLVRALFFPPLFLLPAFPYSILPFADIVAIFTRSRRCLHDYAAGTSVIARQSEVKEAGDEPQFNSAGEATSASSN